MNDTQTIKEGQEEFNAYPDMGNNNLLPDFNQMMAQRLQQKGVPVQQDLPGFDPHQMMVKKHKIETGEVPPDLTPEIKWPEADVKALDDFCQKHGILGFSAGRMSPLAALAFLKKKMGMDYTDVPLEDRIPYGYQRRGTPTNNISPNYPYQKPPDSRRVLNG